MTEDEVKPRVAPRPKHVVVLAGMLAVGVVLRLWVMVTWRPAFVGYYDAGSYALAAKNGVFSDPFRPAGYPIFLRLLHGVSSSVVTVTAVQHLLGIATALILYVAARRLTTSPWVALIAPAVVLLDGFEVLVEHAVLSDSLFIFLVAVALFTVVQAPQHRILYALIPALVIAAASTVRTLGLFLTPIVLLALVWPHPRDGLKRAAIGAAAVALVLGGYLHFEKQQVGATGFSRAPGWSSYSRIGQFADCSKFTPPKGTEKLCEARPPSVRPGTDFYFWSAGSPAQRTFGPPNGSDQLVGKFAHAAIKGQPLDYLEAVGQDFARSIWPEHYRRRRSGETQARYLEQANTQRDAGFVAGELATYYSHVPETHRVATQTTSAYMSVTWVRGPLMALLLLLALASPFLARGAARRAALIFGASGYVLLIVPVATQAYDARYVLSALGPLSVAASLAIDAVLVRRAESLQDGSIAEPVPAAV